MADLRTVRIRALAVAGLVTLLALAFVRPAILAAWLGFVGYLFAMKSLMRPNAITDRRLAHDVPAIAGIVLVLLHALSDQAWGRLPPDRSVQLAGTLLTFVGVAFAGWSRWELAEQWSNTPAVKDRPRVVQSGPYAWFRHPMYVGLGVASVGTAAHMGAGSDFLAVALIGCTFWMRAHRENALLASIAR